MSMSVPPLQSDDKAQLIALADHILHSPRGLLDPAVRFSGYPMVSPTMSITPIARIRDGHYELDLCL